MKKRTMVCLSVAVFLTAFGGTALAGAAVEVRPGDDLADALRRAGKGGQVLLADGVHRLSDTLRIGPSLDGVTVAAKPGAHPVVSGGRAVTGWRAEANGLWSAPVDWVTDREHGFRLLSVNGELRPRAKHPNDGYFTALELKRPENMTWLTWDHVLQRHAFPVNAGEVDPAWKLANGEVIVYHFWNDSHCIPSGVVESNGTNWVALTLPLKRNPSQALWRLENLKEIADRPGEWVLDYGERRVWYRPMPGEDLTKALVLAPYVETLVRIDGAKGVRFEGVEFSESRFELAKGDRNDTQASCTVSAAAVLTNAEACVFRNCAFTRLSGYALDFQAGARDCRVQRCSLVKLGAGGVRLNRLDFGRGSLTQTNDVWRYRMPDPRLSVAGNEISDCVIADYGRDFPSAVGVLCMNAEGTKIVHNDIHDGYYTGVSVGWTWGYCPSLARDNEIEYNHIWNIGKGLISDMGGIYTLGVSPGTKLRYNLIHDIDARCYGGWGIYPDEGSTGLLIENNVVYDTKFAPFHQHFGRNNTVRNNIFAGGRIDQLARSSREDHTSVFFYNNIVWWEEGQLHTGVWEDDKPYEFIATACAYRPRVIRRFLKSTECDYNLYFNPKTALKDVKWGSQHCTWDDWRGKYQQDAHSVWADPLFKDAKNHDYTLPPESPALKLGFRPIDLSQVGPRRP